MKKIRIGNDVRLKLNIDSVKDINESNIKQVRCYLINTSLGKDESEALKKHARRFTREVFPDFCTPSAYNMHGCCRPTYHVHPANICNYNKFLPDFHDYHWWPGFRGFGVHPDHFDCCHEHCCHFPHIEHYEHPFVTGPDRFPQPWYLAEAEVIKGSSAVTCMFPAVDQHFCGVYKLVVVLTLFEYGWGKHNLRTYTIDKGDVFELVHDDSGTSGDVTITIGESDSEPIILVNALYAENPYYTLASNNILHIGGQDIDKHSYNIHAMLADGTMSIYDPYDWRLNELVFTSSDDSVVTVDSYGTLYAHELAEQETEKEVTIRVSNADDQNIYYDFTVIVKNVGTSLWAGFSYAETYDRLQDSDLHEFNTGSQQSIVVNNDVDGKFLWIKSAREINNIKSSMFEVPLKEPVRDGSLYIYRSAAAILRGDINIDINY